MMLYILSFIEILFQTLCGLGIFIEAYGTDVSHKKWAKWILVIFLLIIFGIILGVFFIKNSRHFGGNFILLFVPFSDQISQTIVNGNEQKQNPHGMPQGPSEPRNQIQHRNQDWEGKKIHIALKNRLDPRIIQGNR